MSNPPIPPKGSCRSYADYDVSTTFWVKQKNNSSIKVKIGESAVIPVTKKKWYTVMEIRSSRYKEYLSERMYSIFGKTPGAGALKSAQITLSGIARRQNIIFSLYNRVAPDPNGNGFWIDLHTDDWRVIHVTEEGWEIKDRTPIPMFRRFNQGPLTIPIKTKNAKESVKKLLKHHNLESDVDKLIYMCALISFFVPEIEHPGLSVSGSHGSGKTMFFELSKKIVDPIARNPKGETISMSDKEDNLTLQLYQSHFPCFDNVSSLKGWQSNLLCRSITGGVIIKRKLWTDGEVVMFQLRQCLGLDGINVPARKSDLMDRLILFKLERFKKNKSKAQIFVDFEKDRAEILGGILTVLSNAIKIKKTIKIDNHQRLADFHEWGCAIAVALGYSVEEFNEAYDIKVNKQNEESLSSSLVATTLLDYLKNYVKEKIDEVQYDNEDAVQTFTIEKTATELFREVTEFANEKKIRTSKGYWPTDASQFSRKLNEVLPNLEKVGIIIKSHDTSTSKLKIIDVTTLMSEQKEENIFKF